MPIRSGVGRDLTTGGRFINLTNRLPHKVPLNIDVRGLTLPHSSPRTSTLLSVSNQLEFIGLIASNARPLPQNRERGHPRSRYHPMQIVVCYGITTAYSRCRCSSLLARGGIRRTFCKVPRRGMQNHPTAIDHVRDARRTTAPVLRALRPWPNSATYCSNFTAEERARLCDAAGVPDMIDHHWMVLHAASRHLADVRRMPPWPTKKKHLQRYKRVVDAVTELQSALDGSGFEDVLAPFEEEAEREERWKRWSDELQLIGNAASRQFEGTKSGKRQPANVDVERNLVWQTVGEVYEAASGRKVAANPRSDGIVDGPFVRFVKAFMATVPEPEPTGHEVLWFVKNSWKPNRRLWA